MKRFFIRINYLSVVLIYFTFQNISILKAEVHNTPELKVKKEPALGLQNDAGKKIICFLSKNFPTVDAPVIDTSLLKNSLAGFPVKYCDNLESLKNNLNADSKDILLLPYGSAFPVDAWPAIYKFLSSGGGLVIFGGYPFHQPVIRQIGHNNKGQWILGTPQPIYTHELLIGPADTIVINSSSFYSNNSKIINANEFNLKDISMPSKVFELTVRFTTKKDFPGEDGTSGPRDAVLRPLIHIINGDGIPVACPLLEIDRLQGSEAGARWILEPSDAKLNSSIIKSCIERALEGASQLTAVPEHASVNKDEIPVIRINQYYPSSNKKINPNKIEVSVIDDKNKKLFEGNITLSGYSEFQTGEIRIKTAVPLPPGFYNVTVKNNSTKRHPNVCVTGFWVMDKKLLGSGPVLSVSKDWILKDGKVFPIIGTTYMASDVDRKFLFEPNPYLWNKDFELMEKEGVNFIRTGIWTGWKRIMLDPGSIDENVLRALDAFILTAANHNIIVCLNLFAFSPPLNGGSNPYLDPRALDWQKNFVTLIVSRYKNIDWVNYDLINEPSYTPPDDLWKTLPIHDPYENAAWINWIKKNHKKDAEYILDEWRDESGDINSTPQQSDLSFARVRENRQPRKALDFERFTQDVVADWADTLNKVIKSSAGSDALVTLGEDEGGTFLRPSQQFFYNSVDYTSMHTWWYNDDLLWDGVFTKVPGEPNLISETGIMRLENIDGEPWLNPFQAEKLLERKFAYAFAGRGAGVLQWAWNINPYQPIDNEAVIGFFRPDGTAKIELKVLKEFSSFFKKAQPYLGDYQKSDVILIIPHSKMFSGRPNSDKGTQRIIHILADNFGIVPTMLSEYKLTRKRLEGSKLIILSDPEMLYDSASALLYDISKQGTKVLITGSVDGNEYGQITEQFKKLNLNYSSEPVSQYEYTNWGSSNDQKENYVTYDQGQTIYLRKSSAPMLLSLNGNILQEPLPLEMAREKKPLIALLKNVLDYSGVETHYSDVPVTLSILKNSKTALIICVNESSNDLLRKVILNDHTYQIPVAAGRSVLTLVDLSDKKIIETTSEMNKINIR